MLRDKRFGVGLLLAAVLLGGCSSPPQAEVEAAQAALGEAEGTGAESYAPEAYSKAQESLAQANAEVEAQKERFVLMRSYGRAKQLLRQAREDAVAAKTAAEAGAVAARENAEAAINAARLSLDAAQVALATAPAGKDSRADLEIMRGDLDALRSTLAEADAAFGSSDYVTAQERAQQVEREARAVSADIAQAVRKTRGR
jgi:hypothetical protein